MANSSTTASTPSSGSSWAAIPWAIMGCSRMKSRLSESSSFSFCSTLKERFHSSGSIVVAASCTSSVTSSW